MSGHIREVCEYGKVHRQCRCPALKQDVQIVCDIPMQHGNPEPEPLECDFSLTWKDVFNTNNRLWGSQQNVRQAAKDVGYQYYTWNHQVYAINSTTPIMNEDEIQ